MLQPEREIFHLQLSVTNACNLQCVHCYREETKAFRDELSVEEMITLFQDFKGFVDRLGMDGVITFGGGEPLLRRDLGLLSRVAHSQGLGVRVISNGVLSARQAESLADWGIRLVQISLDGATAEVHDRVRGQGMFARTLEGIRHLVAAGITVNLKATLMKGFNDHQIPEFFALANAIEVPVLSFGRLIPIGAGAELTRMTPAEYRRIYDTISEEAMRSPQTRVEFREPGFDRSMAWGRKQDFRSSEGNRHLAIDADGTVYSSRRMGVVIGNIRRSSLDELWAHPLLVTLREGAVKGKCRSCELYAVCKGGSRAAAFATTADPLAEDPDCWFTPAAAPVHA
jgi:radical SAM protein with 4Fe4S-binding SPASM domain